MPLTKLTAEVNNIQTLADRPAETATQLKVIFDKAAADIKAYLNNTLTEEADATFATKDEVADIYAGGVADGSVTDAKLSNAEGQIKERVATHLADYANRGLTAGSKNIDNVNLNTIVSTGFYFGTGCVNRPVDLDGYIRLQVISIGGSNYCKQIISGLDTIDGGWSRVCHGDIWGDWVPMVSKDSLSQLYVTGTYTGDGTANRTITLGFRPKTVTIMPSNGINHVSSYLNDGGLALDGYPAQANSDAGLKNLITIVPTGFSVGWYSWHDGTTNVVSNNTLNVLYHYKADR